RGAVGGGGGRGGGGVWWVGKMACCAASWPAASRFWLRSENFSEAENWMVPVLARRSENCSARSKPFLLSQSAVYATPGLVLIPRTTSSASAIPGTALGLTKETIWMWSRPVCDKASISAILRAVAIGPFSI